MVGLYIMYKSWKISFRLFIQPVMNSSLCVQVSSHYTFNFVSMTSADVSQSGIYFRKKASDVPIGEP